MNKKNLAIVIGIIVVVIVIVGVIGFNHRAKAPEVSSVAGSTSTVTSGASTPTSTATSSPEISGTPSTSTSKNYTGASFSFTYPGAWAILSGSPLLITNFNGQYKANGVIPPGGIQLIMVTTTISGNLDSIMASDLAKANDLTTSAVTVDGVACAEATYQVNYAPGATAQNVSVYCPRGTTLWKIYFSYPANDPAASTDTSEFNAMLASMKLVG